MMMLVKMSSTPPRLRTTQKRVRPFFHSHYKRKKEKQRYTAAACGKSL